LIEGQLAETGPAGSMVECAAGGRLRVAQKVDVPPGTSLWVAVRPEKIEMVKEAAAAGENSFAGAVTDIGYLGDSSVFKVKLDNGLVLRAAAANRTRALEQPLRRGDRVCLRWPHDAGVLLVQ
jgi:putrescine transport system ATP-binding protein